LKAISALLISQEAFSTNDKAPLPCGDVLGPLPDGFDLTRDTFRAWIAALPSSTSCTALGLSKDADERREARAATTMLDDCARLIGTSRETASSQVNDEDIDALMDELAHIRTGTGGAVADAARREVAAALIALKRDGSKAAHQARAALCLASGQAVSLNSLERPAQLIAALKIDAAAALNASLDDLELAVVGDGLALAGVSCRGLEPVAPFTIAWRPRATNGVLVPLVLAREPLAPPLAEVRVEAADAVRNPTFVAE
jgi:hypothetical protein